MWARWALWLALAWSGCRSDAELAPADLSSAALYCPPSPPAATAYLCDPTAIPFCAYPDLELTCLCQLVDGRHALVCPADLGARD